MQFGDPAAGTRTRKSKDLLPVRLVRLKVEKDCARQNVDRIGRQTVSGKWRHSSYRSTLTTNSFAEGGFVQSLSR